MQITRTRALVLFKMCLSKESKEMCNAAQELGRVSTEMQAVLSDGHVQGAALERGRTAANETFEEFSSKKDGKLKTAMQTCRCVQSMIALWKKHDPKVTSRANACQELARTLERTDVPPCVFSLLEGAAQGSPPWIVE